MALVEKLRLAEFKGEKKQVSAPENKIWAGATIFVQIDWANVNVKHLVILTVCSEK